MAIKVLIVDDSLFFRKRLTEIINSDPRLEVVATAANGQEALTELRRHKPDVITMDFEMPVMDGITAVRKIMDLHPTPILMLSTWTTQGAKSTLDALEAGAVDFLPKRFEDLSSNQRDAQQKICERIHHLATGFHAKQQTVRPTTASSSASQAETKDVIHLVVIGTSTGGPVALQKVLTQLPANFPHPLLLVQHMPATFTPSFAERLNSQCQIRVKQAEHGETLVAGTAYLAPGGQQMLLKGRKSRPYLEIEDGQSNQTYKPCIDLTLESVAKVCPAETLAIILTGMGADGRDGCRSLRQQGATIWAQDQQSSTIYGMPMAVAKAGLADKILSVNDIGRQLADMK